MAAVDSHGPAAEGHARLMDAARRQILIVAGKALAMLPIFLAAWYFAAAPLAWIAGKVAIPAIRFVADGPTTMELKGRSVVYTVKLETPYRPGAVTRIAADIEVDTEKFTYGIALFLALALAAPQSRGALGILAGCLILVMTPAFGIAFDALKQLGSTHGLEPFVRWGGGTREFVALGYQVGTLLLPTLGPAAIWLFIARSLWAPEPTLPL
jgi:hypothetical protein